MLLTEKEANSKECPESQSMAGGPCQCTGTKCMAWRWKHEPTGVRVMKKTDDGFEDLGYCGLAGKPEGW